MGDVRLYCRANFVFQAEDGIRDRNVTGVQTCALPILGVGGQGHGLIRSSGRSPGPCPRWRTRRQDRTPMRAPFSRRWSCDHFFPVMEVRRPPCTNPVAALMTLGVCRSGRVAAVMIPMTIKPARNFSIVLMIPSLAGIW